MKLSEVYSKLQKISQLSVVEKYAARKEGNATYSIQFKIKSDDYYFKFDLRESSVEYHHVKEDKDVDEHEVHFFFTEDSVNNWAIPLLYKLPHLIDKNAPKIGSDKKKVINTPEHPTSYDLKVGEYEPLKQEMENNDRAEYKDDEVLNRLVKEAYEKVLKSIKASMDSFNSKPVNIKIKVETTYSDE